MRKIKLSFQSFFIVLILLSFEVQADKLVSTVQSEPGQGVGRYSQFVLAALLKDMGLDYSEERKSDSGKDNKRNEDQSGKSKKKVGDEDFFNDDDGFFDEGSDFDSMSYEDAVASFDKEYEDTVKAWDKEYEETVKRWSEAKKVYNKVQDKYAETTYAPSDMLSSSENVAPLESSKRPIADLNSYQAGEYHVIPHSLQMDIRNQRYRGTCAAFAGVRAVETVLNQGLPDDASSAHHYDLSEQHFYWLSKRNCMKEPCQAAKVSEGSFFDEGFLSSAKDSPITALKDEAACPYVSKKNSQNLTFTPLESCHKYQGIVRVNKINQYLKPEQIFQELAANRPIAAGFRLPKSFYENNGLVRLHDPKSKQKGTDSHSGGHAVLLVGFIKLPDHMHQHEGKFCAVMANSWGSGYGIGGYACLSEKWMSEYLIRLPKYPEHGLLTSVAEVTILK